MKRLCVNSSSLYSYKTYFGFSRDNEDHVFNTNAEGAVFIIPRLWRKGSRQTKI